MFVISWGFQRTLEKESFTFVQITIEVLQVRSVGFVG